MGAPMENSDRKKPANDSSAVSTYVSLVQQYLAVFQLDNAIFLAERCVAEYSNCSNISEVVYLLALAHYRKNSPKTAREILQQCPSATPSIAFLSAQCSVDLQEFARAESSLLDSCRAAYKQQKAADATLEPMDEWILSTTPCPVPNGAAGVALLGKICRATNRREKALKYYEMSLRLDPFLWTSFESLAELGAGGCDPSELFGASAIAGNANRSAADLFGKTLPPMETPAKKHFGPAAGLRSNSRSVHFETPGLTPIPVNASLMPAAETPKEQSSLGTLAAPPQSILRRARDVASRHYYPPSPETPMTNMTKSMRYLRGLGANSAGGAPLKGAGRSLFGENSSNVKSSGSVGITGPTTSASEELAIEKPKDQQNEAKVQEILDLLCAMGKCYQQVCNYRCKEALQSLQNLPVKQQVSGWVLHQQGRAHLELNDFSSAERALQLMQIQDPSRLKGLELLSTVYWQLKKEVDLAHLAQKVTDWDRLAPESWCVVGNCFSLQKDHETALVFFQRSLQLDPNFTYTHTLAGYEYMANEDFGKAIACFRQALLTDERHYNAWYGLGAIYQRQEKYDLAEYHFEKAVSLNPSSSALRCNLGMAQFSNGKAYQALDSLKEAFALDPRNPQARFQRANIYMALHRPTEALSELEKVRDAAPREATVHFSMGKVYKKLGRSSEALKCFLTAMDLDPKGNQAIKSALEKLEEPDTGDDDGDIF